MAPKKRKRGDRSSTSPQRRAKRAAGFQKTKQDGAIDSSTPSVKTENDTSSLLYKLPAELRNCIYELLAEDETAHVTSGTHAARAKGTSSGKVTARTGLALSGFKIRREYRGILQATALTVVAHVVNLDFKSVTAWLKDLPAAELDRFKGARGLRPRTLRIRLFFTTEAKALRSRSERWLKDLHNLGLAGIERVWYKIVERELWQVNAPAVLDFERHSEHKAYSLADEPVGREWHKLYDVMIAWLSECTDLEPPDTEPSSDLISDC